MRLMQRHREILRDYTVEYHKTRSNIQTTLVREKLMTNSTGSPAPSSKNFGIDDPLVREDELIHRSEVLLDSQIDNALRTREALRQQRSSLQSVQAQLVMIGSK